MEYLNKVLGIKVTYEDVEFKHWPNFIATRYRLQMVDGIYEWEKGDFPLSEN